MMTKSKAKTQFDKVHSILTSSVTAREDDFVLWATLLKDEGIIDSNEYAVLSSIRAKTRGNSFEAISRARRAVQEKFPKLVSATARRSRKSEELNYKKVYGHN